jgi:hypothetical protein
MGGSQLVPRLWERALRRTVSAPGGPRLFKIAQAISGLVRREFGSQCRSFLTRGGREGVGSSRVLFSEQMRRANEGGAQIPGDYPQVWDSSWEIPRAMMHWLQSIGALDIKAASIATAKKNAPTAASVQKAEPINPEPSSW